MPAIPSITTGPEAAMTLLTAPMLIGPTTIPSRAVTNSSRWMTFMSLMTVTVAWSDRRWKGSHENVRLLIEQGFETEEKCLHLSVHALKALFVRAAYRDM